MKNVISFLCLLIFSIALQAQNLAEYDYYREISLSSPTPVNNFQVSFDLTTTNFSYAHVQTDGSDIRFAQLDETVLDYWFETWNYGGNSTIWVEVAESGTSTICMYYGNATSVYTGDAANTFDYYFDFESGSLNDWSFTYSTNGSQSGSISIGDWVSGIDSSNPLEQNYSAFSKAFSNASAPPWNIKAIMHKEITGGLNDLALDVKFRFDDAADGQLNNGTSRFLMRFFNDDRSLNYQYGFDKHGDYGHTKIVVSDGQLLDFTANFTEDFFTHNSIALTDNFYLDFYSMGDYGEYSSQIASAHTTIDQIKIRKTTEPEIIPVVGVEIDNPLPVTLSAFSAVYQQTNSAVTINWTSESETDMNCYNLYRSSGLSSPVTEIISLLASNTPFSHTYSYQDEEIQIGETYFYWLEAVSLDCSVQNYGPVSVEIEDLSLPELPLKTALFGNFPNPFNPETTIKFDIKEGETASLTIYSLKGEKVMMKDFPEGTHSYIWNAKVGSGIYFYKLSTESFNETRKMIFLK